MAIWRSAEVADSSVQREQFARANALRQVFASSSTGGRRRASAGNSPRRHDLGGTFEGLRPLSFVRPVLAIGAGWSDAQPQRVWLAELVAGRCWRPRDDESEVSESVEEMGERDASLCERRVRSEAEVLPGGEPPVMVGVVAVESELVGLCELGWVSIRRCLGGAQHVAGGNGDTVEFVLHGGEPVSGLHRALPSDGLVHSACDQRAVIQDGSQRAGCGVQRPHRVEHQRLDGGDTAEHHDAGVVTDLVVGEIVFGVVDKIVEQCSRLRFTTDALDVLPYVRPELMRREPTSSPTCGVADGVAKRVFQQVETSFATVARRPAGDRTGRASPRPVGGW